MNIGTLIRVYAEVNGEKIPAEVRIPSQVKGITVTSIELEGEEHSVFPIAINWEEMDAAFNEGAGIGEEPNILDFYNGYDTKITTIIIPNTVTRIGYSAFAYLQWIENISIPNSVTEIGDCSFMYCQSLKNIILSEKLKTTKIRFFSKM